MALTLNEVLAAAQDSQSRHPLCRITSRENIADIPFDGQPLPAGADPEWGVNSIAHSSGRLCTAYIYQPASGAGSRGIKYTYTDEEQTEFITETIELFTLARYTLQCVSLCELTNGNIGLVYSYNDSTTARTYIAGRILTVEGELVAGSVTAIGNWLYGSIFTSDLWVQAIGSNSYLMVYGKQSGSNYYVYKRTSSDFLTWSAEAALSIGGIATTYKIRNPHLCQLVSGQLWLWFDALEDIDANNNELTNVYYSVSDDLGANWANAVKFTDCDKFSEIAQHPVMIQKTTDAALLMFTKLVSALHMSSSATGWPTDRPESSANEICFDPATRKMYVINYGHTATSFRSVVEIDVDTWVISRYWDLTTVPAFPSGVGATQSTSLPYLHYSKPPYIVVVCNRIICLLNVNDNTIVTYNLAVTGGNVTGVPDATRFLYQVVYDDTNKRLWIVFATATDYFEIGYIDTTRVADYQYNLFYGGSLNLVYALYRVSSWRVGLNVHGGIWVDEENSRLVLSGGRASCPAPYQYTGFYFVFDILSGGVIKFQDILLEDDEQTGMGMPFVFNNKIYTGGYTTNPGIADRRAYCLLEIDLTTYEVYKVFLPYYDPDLTGQYFHRMSRPVHLEDYKIAYVHYPYGIIVFDTLTREFTVFSNTSVPGLTTGGVNPYYYTQLAYDSTNKMIMCGHPAATEANRQVIMFSINGYIRQTYYREGTYQEGVGWDFDEASVMMRGYSDYSAVGAVDPSNEASLYVFWERQDPDTSRYIKWDKEGSQMDVSQYIVGEVTTEHSIDGSPARLSLAVSHGHLFDPYNLASLFHRIFRKGRKLILEWGEKVGIIDYWQAAGEFFVTETSLEFEKGTYPVMRVGAEDRRCFWNNSHIYTTSIYSNNTPKQILDGVLEDFGGLDSGDRDIPEISAALIEYQGVETNLEEIIKQICNRFGHYFRFDVNGKATTRFISNDAIPDHIYSNNTKLLQYSPDDRYSDFTNRVTVRGQSLEFVEVIYPEERVGAVSGTLGWWGCKADHVVWYSEDRSRRCRNPRMVIIESSASIGMNLVGSVREYLREGTGDDADKYCTVYIEAPSLMMPFIVNVASLIASAFIPDTCVVVGFIFNAGFTIRVGSAISVIAMFMICNILGSVANYQIEVWASPLGMVRQGCQATWNDEEHQVEINAVVEQVIDEPLCYNVRDCMEVAAFEGMVVQMQRRRLRIKKIAHLQDEDGDTIRFAHPYGRQNIDLFVTSLRRSFKKGNDGYFYDEIEGWVCP